MKIALHVYCIHLKAFQLIYVPMARGAYILVSSYPRITRKVYGDRGGIYIATGKITTERGRRAKAENILTLEMIVSTLDASITSSGKGNANQRILLIMRY